MKVGIIGGSGYTAGELIRLLLNHPKVEISTVLSRTHLGKPVDVVHDDLFGQTDLCFDESLTGKEELVFLCTPHGASRESLEQLNLKNDLRIIDLSRDFRLQGDSRFGDLEFVYGLPELQKDDIKASKNVANPGCFATAIQLALLPLASEGLINDAVHVSAITGSSGAGRSLSETTHFTWRSDNISVYKAFTHQHLDEIEQSLTQLQSNFDQDIFFLPHRGNFSRGIFASCYTKFDKDLSQAFDLYKTYYDTHPFTFVSEREVHLKQVVGTNNCFINLYKHKDVLLVQSAIDNLIKGASGQAVQNMNLMMGWEETLGLKLKSINV